MSKNLNKSLLEYQLTIKTIYGIEISLDEIRDAYEIINYEK